MIITASANVVGFVSRWKQRKKFCAARTISKLQKKIILVIFWCVRVFEINLEQYVMICNKRIEVIKKILEFLKNFWC